MFNNIADTDSYKLCHFSLYPKDAEFIYAYLESRAGALFPETKFFGSQYILNQLAESFTNVKAVAPGILVPFSTIVISPVGTP